MFTVRFFSAMFSDTDPNGELGSNLNTGLLFDQLVTLERATVLDNSDIEFCVYEYNRYGMHGLLN